jgi:L-alanine-DL-glutamate epimerase-like enolase superfamily enzyme
MAAMRITAVETLHAARYPHLTYVRVHTDDGLVGLGETFFGPAAVAAHIHESSAPSVLGEDPRRVELHRSRLSGRGVRALGAEGRALSAVDVALWDLAGQAGGRSICELLGGPVRERIRAYNTCAGYMHPGWGVGGPTSGPYDDFVATVDRPEALAESLLSDGFTALKLWPFVAGEDGAGISPEALRRGLDPIRRIRRAHGDAIEILVDGGRWPLPVAQTIARALEEYRPYWLEDFVPDDEPAAWRALAATTAITLAGGEDLGGRRAFRDLLDAGVGVPIFDPGWVGGVTEARAVIALAEAYGRPFCPHDCTGPISFVVGAHLCMAAPNALMGEVVRAYLFGAYREIVTELPRVEGGYVHAPEGVGLGTRLTDGFLDQAESRISRL